MVRVGECNRCGDCCKDESSPTGYCEAFRWGADGLAVCLAHNDPSHPLRAYYLSACAPFPQVPYVTLPHCSFTFMDDEE